MTIAADAERRAVIFVTETREAAAIERLAADMAAHGGDPPGVEAVSIDKYHVIAHASHALDQTRRWEQKRDPTSKACAGNC